MKVTFKDFFFVKGGTIIRDHIDFGGGKGADADGERF